MKIDICELLFTKLPFYFHDRVAPEATRRKGEKTETRIPRRLPRGDRWGNQVGNPAALSKI